MGIILNIQKESTFTTYPDNPANSVYFMRKFYVCSIDKNRISRKGYILVFPENCYMQEYVNLKSTFYSSTLHFQQLPLTVQEI